jgi:hypothetical protein
MQEEFKEPKYGEYHLFFTNLTREGQIQQLAQAVRCRLSSGLVPGPWVEPCACMPACARARVRACARACVRAAACVAYGLGSLGRCSSVERESGATRDGA